MYQTDRPKGETRRGGYIRRHWRGELSLPRSYWINGLLVSLGFTGMVRMVPWDAILGAGPRLFSVLVIGLWFLIAATTLWQLAGIWSSAGNYLREGRSRLWGNAARIAAILSFLCAVANFVTAGIPQVSEYARIAAGGDRFGRYQVRACSEMPLKSRSSGTSDSVSPRTYSAPGNANPGVRLIHLANSDGGRVVEARALRDLIDSRKLSTYTASGCSSACTLAYAAGRKRLIAPNAKLGFHAVFVPRGEAIGVSRRLRGG